MVERTRWRDPELLVAGVGILGSLIGLLGLLLNSRNTEIIFGLIGSLFAAAAVWTVGQLFERKSRTVFLSFAHPDLTVARRLAFDLKRRGIDVLVAEDEVAPGDSIDQGVQGAIDRSDSLVFLLSPASAASGWMGRELAYAVRSDRRIFPVLVNEVSEIPESLRDIRYVNLREYESGVVALADAIRKGTRARVAQPV